MGIWGSRSSLTGNPGYMTEPISIDAGNRRLLGKLLRLSDDDEGVAGTKFRAENPQLMQRLDDLEAEGLLRRKDDRYFLTLVALSEIRTSEARAILRDAKNIYSILATEYRKSQMQPVLVRHLAASLKMSDERAALVLRYMLEAPWSAGHSTVLKGSNTSSVTPSEKVLKWKSFSSVVDQMRKWHVERFGNPYLTGSPSGVKNTQAAVDSSAAEAKENSLSYAPWPGHPLLGAKGNLSMARDKKIAGQTRAELVVPFLEAQQRVAKQIEKASSIPDASVNENDDARQWYDFTSEVLRRICSTDELVDEFTGKSGFRIGSDISTGHFLKRLRSIYERLELYPAPSEALVRPKQMNSSIGTHRVFVVHGHDDGTREAVARYISKLGLEPIVLHEQPNQGRTIIEKFEDSSDVSFAVVLFTPDDVGHPFGRPTDAKPRARQNVLLELGFFMCALGRDKVCV